MKTTLLTLFLLYNYQIKTKCILLSIKNLNKQEIIQQLLKIKI